MTVREFAMLCHQTRKTDATMLVYRDGIVVFNNTIDDFRFGREGALDGEVLSWNVVADKRGKCTVYVFTSGK